MLLRPWVLQSLEEQRSAVPIAIERTVLLLVIGRLFVVVAVKSPTSNYAEITGPQKVVGARRGILAVTTTAAAPSVGVVRELLLKRRNGSLTVSSFLLEEERPRMS